MPDTLVSSKWSIWSCVNKTQSGFNSSYESGGGLILPKPLAESTSDMYGSATILKFSYSNRNPP